MRNASFLGLAPCSPGPGGWGLGVGSTEGRLGRESSGACLVGASGTGPEEQG